MKHVNTLMLNVGCTYRELCSDIFGYVDCCCDIHWYSRDPDIANISASGIEIRGVSEGTTRFYAEVEGDEIYYFTVIVSGQICVTGIHLNYTKKTLEIGEKFTLTAAVHPAYATNTDLIWTNTYPSVATFEDGIVTAISSGETEIIFRATDGSGTQESCTITVKPNIAVESITVCPEKLEMVIEETQCLCATITPENATVTSLYWTSDDCNIADVDENGCVTAKAVGTTAIRATAKDSSEVYGHCSVEVKKSHIRVILVIVQI